MFTSALFFANNAIIDLEQQEKVAMKKFLAVVGKCVSVIAVFALGSFVFNETLYLAAEADQVIHPFQSLLFQ